ncbi:MAG TPA: SDR family oxidoreductase [Candidatus Nanopelagicales bacterium]|nr:SDR family oxidoreductase [Candidatus Nanopelagicales bacterium]
MRWLITGASGFLGANAVRVLSPSHDVVGLVRDVNTAPWCDQKITADLLAVDALERAVHEVEPDVVLHCAGMANHRACEADEDLATRVNAQASGVLAGAAAARGAAFVYVSTDAVFSGARGWYEENEAVSPNTAYGRTKAAGEEAVLNAHASAVVARTNFFGWSPSGHASTLEFFVRELGAGNRVPGFVDYTVTSLFVEDVVESIERIVGSGESGIFHVVARDAVSKFEFGRLVAAEFGLDESLIYESSVEGRPKDLSLRSDRLSGLLGSAMPSQAEGLACARTSRRF